MLETLRFPNETELQAEVSRSGNLCVIRNPSAALPEDTSRIELIKIISVRDKKDNHEIRTMRYVYGVLEGYSTVYQRLEDGVILSSDGSVYTEPESVPPYVPTLEELIISKKAEVDADCNTAIVNGFDVTISTGVEHFDLKLEDQIALGVCAEMAKAGENAIPWHPNGDTTLPCIYYSAADMTLISNAAYQHRSYHQTYCNSLKVWAQSCTVAEELEAIFYGADVPAEYQSEVLKDYLAALQEEANAINV